MGLLRRNSDRGDDRKRLGRRGERHAARWLRRQGYRILHCNYKVGDDEADLVVLDPDGTTVVIVEVKTRRDDTMPIEASVNARKQFRMARLAARLQRSGPYAARPMRLDAITILWPEGGEAMLKHFPNAFASPI
jgi:putative endonuclease